MDARRCKAIMSRKTTARRTLIAALFAAQIISAPSCKNESGQPSEATFLSLPSVFVPVGVLRQPQGISVDAAGNVWVADTRAGKVRRFSADGVLQDSVVGFSFPTRMGIDRSNNTLLVIDNLTINRINPQTGTALIITTLNGTTIDGSSIFDVNTRTMGALTLDVQLLGDLDGSLTGDVFVGCYGTPENFLVRIRAGAATALASSASTPQNPAERGPHFVAADRFGTVFTSFVLAGTPARVRIYSYSPSSPNLSHGLAEPFVTGAALGSTMDASGNLYITDPATQELIVIATLSERTIARYSIPDVGGYSMVPLDVAVSDDGRVYVVVTDRLGIEAGAVLKYVRNSR